jgi:glycosyltransferase involved in cell wall biosynthesis
MTALSREGPVGPVPPEAPRPFLSVLVTAYRRRNYLREAVRSVLEQDLEPTEFEVIVLKDFVDPDIDAELARAAPTVRVHTEDLRKMGEMISKGIELARGEVVCFLEDDDRFRPGKLRGLRDLFRSSPDLGFVRNGYRGIDAEGLPLPSWDKHRPQTPNAVVLSSHSRTRAAMTFIFHYGAHINLSTMAIRSALVRPWLERFREVTAAPDLFVFLLAAVADRPMRVEAARWNDYRVHSSTSHAALTGGGESKDLADTVRSSVAAEVMERVVAQAPGHRIAERFLACFHREVTATVYLLDPGARWSLLGWLGFVRTILWRRQRYLAAIAVFAVYRAVSAPRAIRAYRNWRFRALRRAAGVIA